MIADTEKAYTWLMAIIISCNNQFHFDSCDVLIELFHSKFGDQELKDELKAVRQATWLKVHEIMI